MYSKMMTAPMLLLLGSVCSPVAAAPLERATGGSHSRRDAGASMAAGPAGWSSKYYQFSSGKFVAAAGEAELTPVSCLRACSGVGADLSIESTSSPWAGSTDGSHVYSDGVLIADHRSDGLASHHSTLLTVPGEGEYTFYVISSMRAQLFVDGELVVFASGGGARQESAGTARLGAGKSYKVEVTATMPAGGQGGVEVQLAGVDGGARRPLVGALPGDEGAAHLQCGTVRRDYACQPVDTGATAGDVAAEAEAGAPADSRSRRQFVLAGIALFELGTEFWTFAEAAWAAGEAAGTVTETLMLTGEAAEVTEAATVTAEAVEYGAMGGVRTVGFAGPTNFGRGFVSAAARDASLYARPMPYNAASYLLNGGAASGRTVAEWGSRLAVAPGAISRGSINTFQMMNGWL